MSLLYPLCTLPHTVKPLATKLTLTTGVMSGDPFKIAAFLIPNAIQLICASWSSGTENNTKHRGAIVKLVPLMEYWYISGIYRPNNKFPCRIINTYLSALSSSFYIQTIVRMTVGSHRINTRLLKESIICYRPLRNIHWSWDMRIFTSYLSTLFSPEQLTLKLFTLKTVMLCML